MIKKIISTISASLSKTAHDLKILLYLFKKENVFQYLLVIFVLMIVAGTVFLLIEKDRIIAVNGGNADTPLFDQIVTTLYWAIVTISSTGYGDISPGNTPGRIMVIILLYSSVASVALFTANLASALTTKKMMERRGIMTIGEMHDHFVILGWKKNMHEVLSEIKYNNPGISFKRIVIIANIDPDALEMFRQQYPALDDLVIIRGEHYSDTILKSVYAEKASKVFILADESTESSPTEMDSKTVMTAMTVRSLSQHIRICAEILDAQYDKYLANVHVDEIIYINEYNKTLIAQSFAYVGLTKVINDLLNPHIDAFMATELFPNHFVGKSFDELREYYLKEKKSILIGLLENVGGYLERKQEALREAQKTANIPKLVENLKNAKKMENNAPNINPEPDYRIPQNSMAILVDRKRA